MNRFRRRMWKRFIATTLSVLLGVGLGLSPELGSGSPTALAEEQPAVPNGGFEQIASGRPADWTYISGTVQSSDEQVRSGASSVKLTDASATSSTGLRSAKMPVTAGQTYSATVYSYNLEGVSQVYLEFWDAADNYTQILIGTNSSLNQWQQMEAAGVAPAGTVSASLRLYLHVANIGSAYFDDAALAHIQTGPASSLLNGDLEDQVGGKPRYWTLPAAAQTSTEQVYSGSYSVKVTDTSNAAGVTVRSHPIAVTPGVMYDSSVWSYNLQGVSQLYVEFWDASNNYTTILTGTNSSLNSWQQINIRGVAPEHSTYATVRFYLHAANVGTAYFDAASFQIAPPDPVSQLTNGSFERVEADKPAGWTETEGMAELYGQLAKDGVNSVKLTMTGTAPAPELHSHPVRVTPGDPYEASVYTTVYGQTYASGGAPLMQLEFRGETGDIIATADGTAGSVSGSWQQWQAVAVAPAGAATATVKLSMQPGTEGASLFDDVRLVRTSGAVAAKTRATYYTPAKVAAARYNVQHYGWATTLRNNAVARADLYLANGTDFLWNAVTGAELPRSYGVNQVLGSPVTGRDIDAYGNYPYRADPLNTPWKIVDPSSGYTFPTNDFAAYYESGLDEHGLFRPELANRSLLVNTLYPEKGPTWGVDDGFGWVNENGDRYTFVAYYNHWFNWYGGSALIQNALSSLRDAYLYTGDMKYARAGAALLDRIADVYPDLDTMKHDRTIYLNSHGGTGLGKAVGSIWETGLVKEFISAYDAFFPAMDDPQLIAYLDGKAETYRLAHRKGSASAIRKNIEDGILQQVYPAVQAARIRGNNGMHQSALAMAAVVYDKLPETQAWIDFVFKSGGNTSNPPGVSGGNVLNTLISVVDRDGHGNEASAGYNALWLNTYRQTADILEGYDLYPAADLYENVKFNKMFTAQYPLILSEKYIANYGDTGSTGNPGISTVRLDNAVKAFAKFGDPIHAQMAYFLNGNRAEGIHLDVFSPDPNDIADDIRSAVATQGKLDMESSHETGHGFSALRDGKNETLSFGLSYAFPDMDIASQTTATRLFEASGTIQLESNAPGDAVAFQFDVPATDDYEINLLPFTAPSYGIYRVSIDGQPVMDLDFYAPANTDAYIVLDQQVLTAGTHTISFANIGKNPASTNYKMGVRNLNLLNAAARDERDNAGPQGNTLRDVWMYYGRNTGHGHADTLNIGIHAFGIDLTPDLGYPEFADSIDMHRAQWVVNTISHNTVVVDKKKQAVQWIADPKHFDDSEWVKLLDVEAPKVYPQTELYKRTTAMVRIDASNSYAVDFFRVKGGSDHHFSFHGAEGDAVVDGLTMTAQPTGTYAGPNVAYGERVDDVAGSGYKGSGFHYLKNVERDSNPPAQFSVDWDIEDTWNVLAQPQDIHLRLTMLGEVDEVALADGIPPQNKPGNPESLRYMVAHRTGTNLDSLFTSVLEPYKENRTITSIAPAVVKHGGAVVTGNDVKAVKVTLANGRIDYIVSALDPDTVYTIDDTLQFKGFFGVYAEESGTELFRYVNDGAYIAPITETAPIRAGALTGTVISFTDIPSLSNEIVVDMSAAGTSPSDWIGRFIYVENDGVRHASYRITSATEVSSGRYRLGIGSSTLIRSFVNPDNFALGYVYDIAPAAAFRIPLAWED